MDIIALTNPGLLVKSAIQNAISLIDEAEILFSHKKYARANLLSLLAMEEVAKASIIDDHYHQGYNPQLKNDLRTHTVKFGSKDKITVMRRQRIALVFEGDKETAEKYEQARQDSMYVGVRNGKMVRPADVRSYKPKTNIRKAKVDLFHFYLANHLTLWPKYEVKLPKPPRYIKINQR